MRRRRRSTPRSFWAALAFASIVLGAAGCHRNPAAPAPTRIESVAEEPRVIDYRNGWYHTASGKESIEAIGKLYMRDPGLIGRLNNFAPEDKPPDGMTLYIPPIHDLDALRVVLERINREPESVPRKPPPLASIASAAEQGGDASGIIDDAKMEPLPRRTIDETSRAKENSPTEEMKADGPHPIFKWPIRGKVIENFKPGRGGFGGITIQAEPGAAIRAVAAGKVVYAGQMRGYGQIVIVDHGDGYASVYANDGKLRVKEGKKVRAAQRLATVGKADPSGHAEIFFQLRRNERPIDPLPYLQ